VDGVVRAFAVVLGLASSLLFGMGPALRASRGDLQGTLREGGRGAGAIRDRVRSALVLGEVALAVTLLVGAGLLVRSALYLGSVRPGFDPERAVMGRVSLPAARYGDPAQVKRAFGEMARTLRESPGVEAASVVSQAPLGGGGGENGLLAEGMPEVRESFVTARLRITGPGYLRAVGIPILQGRGFDDRDVAGGNPVMIVSRGLAERLFPGSGAIGKRVACCDTAAATRWKTVVGVAGDVRWRGIAAPIEPEFYLPLEQIPGHAWEWVQRTMALVARGETDVASAAAALRASVRAVDPAVPIFQVTIMRDAVRRSTAAARFNTGLLTALGIIGLALAVVGIYGVVSYFVAVRTHEIGIRMALGAARKDVLGLMVAQGLRPVVAGAGVGIGAALALTRFLRGALFGVQPTDPLTIAAVVAGLLAVSVAAILIPARRATRVDPMRALDSA
jgi:predicted permease